MPERINAYWTAKIDYEMTENDLPFPLTDHTVAMEVQTIDGQPVAFQGSVTIANAAQGIVRFLPHAADLQPGRYLVRWRITEIAAPNRQSWFPRADWENWTVI